MLAAWALGSLGCAQLIGLEDAQEDPSYQPQGRGGGAGSTEAEGAHRAGGQGGLSHTAGAAATLVASDERVGGAAGTRGVAAGVGAAAGDSASAGRGLAGSADLCSEYCKTVTDNCKAPHAVYTGLDACLAVCRALPKGDLGAEIGNSVACRLRNAQLAETTGEPEVHCPIAGPGGLGTCGSNCEGYCVLVSQVCAAGFSSEFESLVDCNRQCEELTASGPFDVTQKAGNSVGCRLWHSSAASLDPGTHCPHALGAPPCTP